MGHPLERCMIWFYQDCAPPTFLWEVGHLFWWVPAFFFLNASPPVVILVCLKEKRCTHILLLFSLKNEKGMCREISFKDVLSVSILSSSPQNRFVFFLCLVLCPVSLALRVPQCRVLMASNSPEFLNYIWYIWLKESLTVNEDTWFYTWINLIQWEMVLGVLLNVAEVI